MKPLKLIAGNRPLILLPALENHGHHAPGLIVLCVFDMRAIVHKLEEVYLCNSVEMDSMYVKKQSWLA